MPILNKKFFLNETEIRSNYITPAIKNAGWKAITQFREEYPITQGRLVTSISGMKRNKPLHADYVLFYRPNIPLAVVEAKDNNHNVADGIQQALNYAKLLDVPFAFSSNGDGFVFHNKLVTSGDVEISLSLNEFPSPEKLWKMYKEGRNITDVQQKVIDSPYYLDNPEKSPRYYQINAINRTVEAIANRQERILLVMATGTGKTFTAFQIIWRLWKAGIKKRVLFLADRKNLISQTFTNDFAPFKDHMIWVRKSNFDTAHEIYLALYQGLSSEEDTLSLFKQFSPNFFDLVVVDECHRGSARAKSQWREILEYFSQATQIGLTATPKEDNEVSNIDYFGKPIYTYTLKQGIEDGFLAPYRVIRVFFDKDIEGFMPYDGQLDDNGEIIDDRLYNIHPDLKPSHKRNMDEENKRELDNAIIWLDTLEPETFTAADAHSFKNIHAVALATVFGFSAKAEKFFKTIKDAKAIAKNRIKEADADLTKKLTDDEKNELTALIEGINLDSIRRTVDREITAVTRARVQFLREEKKQAHRIEIQRKREEKESRAVEAKSRLDELRAMPSSPERDAEMIELIRESCDWHCNKQGFRESVKSTVANIDKIFTYDPYLDGLFGYDEFNQVDVFLKAPPWNKEKKGTELTDRDDSQLQMYIRRTYTEFANEKLTLQAVTAYSDAHRFHVIKDFFHSLPTWDGTPRAEKLFVTFLGADDTPYVHEVTLNVLTAAVARIFHPGCDYQTAPIILGEQGIGKSHMLGKLFGKWYGSLVDDVSDPHAIDAIQKLWGVEIKEMAAMKKDIDANKRFIDSAKDTRRQAYDRRATTIPRHCVFFITTNNKMCLTDMTGNRRYPIIVCHNKPRQYVEGLTDQYIQQVWAEIFAHYNELFKDGFDEHKLVLSRDSQMLSDEIAEDYLRDDGMESEIRSYLDTKILPPILWFLLTRAERYEFEKNGRLVIINALSEFNHRRRARGGRPDTVQRDVDLISSLLIPSQNKPWLRIEHKTIQGNNVDEYILYGSELRQHICAVEIYNECFGNDKRKSPTRINEILNRIEGWSLGADIARDDPAYLRQRKVFYREAN